MVVTKSHGAPGLGSQLTSCGTIAVDNRAMRSDSHTGFTNHPGQVQLRNPMIGTFFLFGINPPNTMTGHLWKCAVPLW